MTTDMHVHLLKQVLENLRFPDRLESHPWVNSLTVKEAAAHDRSLAEKSPGTQLVLTLGVLFRQMMPSSPPQQTGKRLDTRWGRFGILAANYFAPLLYGRQYPRSVREAWRRIDQAILLFVYGLPADELKPEQVKAYQLLGDEADPAANSTISDWHRDGLQDLADLFVDHEKRLSQSPGQASVLFDGQVQSRAHDRTDRRHVGPVSGRWHVVWRWSKVLLLTGFLVALALLVFKGWQAYGLLQSVKQDVSGIEQLDLSSLKPGTLEQVGPLLVKTHQDVEMLRGAASPWLWLTPGLGWVPIYGGDFKYAGDLLEMASSLTGSASQTYQSAFPIWTKLHEGQGDLKASELTGMLLNVQPALLQSQAILEQGIQARRRIGLDELSPAPRSWLTRADPYISGFDEALSVSLTLPRLLGGSNEGPKTYLILVQNEDELRATGGFITAVGKVVVWNGDLMSWSVADSYSVDDIHKAYPPAPWQMQRFMNIPIMTFRDSNWSPDFPKTALWAEFLYASANSYSVNGVIAIDQHVLKTLLSVTGPLYVKEIDTTVTADNVKQTMRTQKVPPPAELGDPGWQRKHFMNPIAAAILERALSGKGLSWERLLSSMLDELNQRHILLHLDDPGLERLLAQRGWDGAVARTAGDYLMVVDTNVGYNKTNAVVRSQLVYDVDLQNLSAPTSSLAVFHQNDARGPGGQCNQERADIDQSTEDHWYAIDRCYYDYLRVYLPAGTYLTSATPHPVTRAEMYMLDQDVPARVDRLDENLEGLQAFGTLLVVPMGGSLETDLHFGLPTIGILQADPLSGAQIYQLKVQKQAGTESIPITIRVHLPTSARLSSISPTDFVQEGANLLFDLDLATDANIRIQFRP